LLIWAHVVVGGARRAGLGGREAMAMGILLDLGESAGRSRWTSGPARKVRAPQGRVVGNADPG
jgi:hypothetical protein